MVAAMAAKPNPNPTHLIFVYGTLKQGFPNHPLLQSLIATGDARFLRDCRTLHSLPLVCGPYRVPFLLNFPGQGHRVLGELYAVSPAAIAKMDELEGVSKGHYERLPIGIEIDDEDDEDVGGAAVQAYYAHRIYAEALWRRNGEEGHGCYNERVAKGYIRRMDRPHHLTFLEQINLFISSPPASATASIPNPQAQSVSVLNY